VPNPTLATLFHDELHSLILPLTVNNGAEMAKPLMDSNHGFWARRSK
jgi:hypothetical protein